LSGPRVAKGCLATCRSCCCFGLRTRSEPPGTTRPRSVAARSAWQLSPASLDRSSPYANMYTSVPISKFVSLHGILVYELRNRKDTGKSMILVWPLVQKSAYELAAAMMRSSESPPLPSWHRYATGAVLAALMKLARARESLYCSQPQNETPKWPTRSRKF
jgi:hypothetical protein